MSRLDGPQRMAAGTGRGWSGALFDGWSTGSTCFALVSAASTLVALDRAFPTVGMGPAYIPLIALAAWRLGLVPACAMAGLAAFLNIYRHEADGVISPGVAMARGALRFGTYVFIVALMIALRRSYDRERMSARRDHLTGALARRAFDERAATLLSSDVQSRRVLALVLVDVDGFKGVNDRHGHAAGDDTLRTLVANATATLRSEDCIGRIGGDEFAAVICAADVEEARRRVATFHRVVSDGLAQAHVPATASMGACILMPGVVANVAAAMWMADQSMYEAKAAGPGGIRIRVPLATFAAPASVLPWMIVGAA